MLRSASIRFFTVWCPCATRVALAWLSPRARRWLRIAWSLLLLALGAGLCVRTARGSDWRDAWRAGTAVGAPLALLLALPSVSLFVKSLGWRSLLPPAVRPSVGRAYVTFVAAQGVNELGFSILGEPLKVLVLPRAERTAGVRAVAADNAIAFAALLAVLLTLSCCTDPRAFVLAAGLALALVAWGTRISRYLVGFAAHYLGKLWLVVELGLGLHFLGQPALLGAAPLAFAWSTAAMLGAAVPGQLGVVEAALVHSGSTLGIALPSLLALALIRRLRALCWLVLGLLLAARILKRNRQETRDVSIAAA